MRERSEPKQVEIDCRVVRETEKAYLIDTGAKENTWIPKSQISDEAEDMSSIFIPEWLAKEKGLI